MSHAAALATSTSTRSGRVRWIAAGAAVAVAAAASLTAPWADAENRARTIGDTAVVKSGEAVTLDSVADSWRTPVGWDVVPAAGHRFVHVELSIAGADPDALALREVLADIRLVDPTNRAYESRSGAVKLPTADGAPRGAAATFEVPNDVAFEDLTLRFDRFPPVDFDLAS